MKTDNLSYMKLSKLLSSIEDEIIKISDSEAINTLNANRKDIDEVTRLISTQLFKHQGNSVAPALRTLSKVRPLRSSNSKLDADIALLRELLKVRPDLSPRLQAVFSSGRSPGEEEIEGLISELVRKGVLPKDE